MKTVYKVLSSAFCLSVIFLFLLSSGCSPDGSIEKREVEGAKALTNEEVAEVIKAHPICDRTEIVKQAIVKAAEKSSCEDLSVEDLGKITILAFHSEDIQEVKASDFAGLTGVKQLLLSNSNLQALPVGLLTHLVNLENFYADRNSLQAIPEGFFNGLTSLKKINLYKNELSSLPEGLFKSLSSLEKVYLGDNNFSEAEKNRLREELGEKLTTI